MRFLLLFLLGAALLLGDAFKLYMKDGEFHLVREYKVEGDRISFYSTERSQWEEIPVALVDLDKTNREHTSRAQEMQDDARQQDEEEKALRAQRREIEAIPMEVGVYYKPQSQVGNEVRALALADYKVITNKKREALKMLSPIPLVPGRASVVIQGEAAKFVQHEDRPEFFFRLAKGERFGIIRLTPKKGVRLVENISVIPVTKENMEDRKQVPAFQQELGDNLYKVWPEKPIEPGEYAVVEYTEGEIEMMIWDFAYRAGTSAKP